MHSLTVPSPVGALRTLCTVCQVCTIFWVVSVAFVPLVAEWEPWRLYGGWTSIFEPPGFTLPAWARFFRTGWMYCAPILLIGPGLLCVAFDMQIRKLRFSMAHAIFFVACVMQASTSLPLFPLPLPPSSF